MSTLQNVNSQTVIYKNTNLAKFQPKPTKQQKKKIKVVGPKNGVDYTEIVNKISISKYQLVNTMMLLNIYFSYAGGSRNLFTYQFWGKVDVLELMLWE